MREIPGKMREIISLSFLVTSGDVISGDVISGDVISGDVTIPIDPLQMLTELSPYTTVVFNVTFSNMSSIS